MATLKGHQDYVLKTFFLPNGHLASCSRDKTIKIWNPLGNELLAELAGIEAANSLVLLQNNLLACASLDHSIVIWSLNEKKVCRTLKGHTDQIISLLLLPNANLASCSWDDTIRIWNPYLANETTSNLLLTISNHGNITRNVNCLGILSNSYLASCSATAGDSVIKIWNCFSGDLVMSIHTQKPGVLALLVLANDNIVVGYNDGVLELFDLTNSCKRKTFTHLHSNAICWLAQLPNGLVVSGSTGEDPKVKIWSPEDGCLIKEVFLGHKSTAFTLSLSRDGLVACGSIDKTITVWSLGLEKLTRSSVK